MKKAQKVSSSSIFNKSNLYDQIHQFILILDSNVQDDITIKIILESLSYLNKNINSKINFELISLISSCFLHFLEPPKEIISNIFNHSSNNVYYILLSASICSIYANSSYPLFNSFVKKVYNQILPQIHKKNLIIFGKEILPIYRANFIIDIVTAAGLNEKSVSLFSPYIFSHENIWESKLNNFISKISSLNLISKLPESVITNKKYFNKFPTTSLPNLIVKTSDEIFIKILPLIEEKFSDKKQLFSQNFVSAILSKCIKLDIEFKLIDNLLDSLTIAHLKAPVWNYLAKFNVMLSDKFANKIKTFPSPNAALKIMPNLDIIPSNVMAKGLLENSDFDVYKRVLIPEFILSHPSQVFSDSKFWINLTTVISQQDTECSTEFVDNVATIFNNFNNSQQFNEILTEIIFNNFPPSKNVILFLDKFINRFDYTYKNIFSNNMNKMLQRIIDSSIIPIPQFWKLTNVYSIKKILERNNANPVLLCGYEFSPIRKYTYKMTELTLLPQTNNSNQELIIEFINNKDLDYIVNMNAESLSLLINAFIYIRNDENTTVNGLTKETILPFFAIGLIYLQIIKTNTFILTPQMMNLILDGCNNLSNNDSPLLIASINSILSNFNYLIINSLSLNNLHFLMLEILIKQLVNNTYSADSVILLSIVFKLSCQNPLNNQTTNLLDKYGFNIYIYIIKNMEKIPDFTKLMNYNLDLNSFNSKKIIDLTSRIIYKADSNKVFIHSICFINKFCKNAPKIVIPKTNVINKVLNELIDEQKWDDVLSVGQFLKDNDFEKGIEPFSNRAIPYKYKKMLFNDFPISCEMIDELVDNILSDPQPETNYLHFESLFKEMMKEQSTKMNYLIILFDKISQKFEIKPETMLQLYAEEYGLYSDIFVNTLRSVYNYHSNNKVFVRRASFDNISKPISKLEQYLLSKLFKETKSKTTNYQAFLCLKNVASSFPFLFSKNPQEIFKSILSPLNDFILYFTIQENEENTVNIDKLKVSITALSFLFSTLYSITVLDAFVPWIYQNIIKFSDSQILCFSFILSSLFNSQKIKDIMVSLAIKYKFVETIGMILKRNFQKEIIDHVKNNFYNVLINFYSILNNLAEKDKLIYIDEIYNDSNPFEIAFDKSTTVFPCKLYELNLPKPPHQISEFWIKINETKFYWITFDFYLKQLGKPSIDQINDFISHFKRLEQNIPDVLNMPTLPNFRLRSAKMLRYLTHQSNWIYQYVVSYLNFSFLPEHIIKLIDIKQELDLMSESKTYDLEDEANIYFYHLKINDYFLQEYCQNELFNCILNDIISHNHQTFNLICSLAKVLIQNEVALLSIISLINCFIIQCRSLQSIKSINKLLKFLISIFEDQNLFKKYFIEVCNSNLIDLILSPNCRNNLKLISNTAKLLNSYQKEELPKKIVHFICFMLILKEPEIIIQALDLCEKIGEKNLNYNIFKRLIENAFEHEFKKEDPNSVVIDHFLKTVPSFIHNKIKSLPSLLSRAAEKYQKNENKDTNSINLICIILNTLAPNRFKDQLNISLEEIDFTSSLTSNTNESVSSPEQDFVVRPVPQKLKATNKKFWNLYEKHLSLINDILLKDEKKISKLKFLFNYPELLNFQTRYNYFRDRMNEKLDTKHTINLSVDRSNILVSSFNALHKKTPNEWLYKFRVSFNGEKGIDVGGLTKEWFTLIAQELFNTNNALYKSSENKSYQPNPSSYINSEHIDYFKFSGRFIARALIQGQCVNAHLMRSFYRQILGLQLKLKDLEDFDEELYHSLEMLLNIDDIEPLDFNFSIDVNEYGVNKNIPLKEDGDNIMVTNENRQEYVSLYANYHLRKSIIQQVDAFCEGFNSLIPQEDICMFSPSELDLMICGIPEIDINDLMNNTIYVSPYHKQHPVIIRFFNVISKWENENKAKLLLFVTGSSQVPVRGFKDYKDRDKPIKISHVDDKDRLCVAHTCFNTLDLPEYENEEEMNDKLLRSIQECDFGLA